MPGSRDKFYKNAMAVVFKWESGVLKAVEHFFNKVEDAVAFGTNKDVNEYHQHIKVYDHYGQCVHDSHDHHHHHDGYA